MRESARAPSRARCHGNTPRPELIISCGKCGRGGRGAGRGGGGSGGGVELPRAGGPERAEPRALRRHWDPVSARPVSRGPGRLGPAGTGSSRRARWALRPPCPGTPLSRSTAGGAATGPRDPPVSGVPLRCPTAESLWDLGLRVARPLGSRRLDPLRISLVGNVQSLPGCCTSTSAPPSPAWVAPRKAAVWALPLCPRVVAFPGQAQGGVRRPLG